MTNQHPITPPAELLDKWDNLPLSTQEIFVIVAQWGADTELEACCCFLDDHEECSPSLHKILRDYRRPKPPSLKEQALNCLADIEHGATPCPSDFDTIRRALEFDTIRRALEQLND